MDWTEFMPVTPGVGPEGVSDETHRIEYRCNFHHEWRGARTPTWSVGMRYRYRLHTADLTQLSDADLDAQAAAIGAERKRRDDDLRKWVLLLAEMFEAAHRHREALNLRVGDVTCWDKAAAIWLRDHTRRAVDEALKAAGHD